VRDIGGEVRDIGVLVNDGVDKVLPTERESRFDSSINYTTFTAPKKDTYVDLDGRRPGADSYFDVNGASGGEGYLQIRGAGVFALPFVPSFPSFPLAFIPSHTHAFRRQEEGHGLVL
jgi:hypothetical protein